MKCKKCGIEIDDFEMYCDGCKKILKKEKELDKLVVENKELNKLEITKEVETLEKFKDEKKESIRDLKEELKDIVNIEEEEIKEKNNRLAIIIAIISIFISISIIFVSVFFIFSKEEPKKDNNVINYEQVLNNYGDAVTLALSEYLKDKNKVPSWSVLSDLVNYDEHEVICNIHNIYEAGTIYLNDCKVDDKMVTYSYGEEQQEIKEGKKIEVYKKAYDNNYYLYSNQKEDGSELAGNVTCKTEDCEYIDCYEKYILIKENNEYYIYNYETNSMEFGPFQTIDNNYGDNMISYDNKLYGVLYEEDNKQNIYSINNEKTLKNIEGKLLLTDVYIDPNLMFKYGYAVFEHNDKNNFVNLKTGNVSYTINGILNAFIEDTTKNLVYITTYNTENSKITIYNSNGKKLFNGNEFNSIHLSNGNIIVSDDNKFYVYDSNLKVKVNSKEYNDILSLYNDFIVVIDNEYLGIVDFNDNILATFDLKWDSSIYTLNSMLSGKFKENNKDIIYLVVDSTNETLKYYYDVETKEIGTK